MLQGDRVEVIAVRVAAGGELLALSRPVRRQEGAVIVAAGNVAAVVVGAYEAANICTIHRGGGSAPGRGGRLRDRTHPHAEYGSNQSQ